MSHHDIMHNHNLLLLTSLIFFETLKEVCVHSDLLIK